MGTKKGDVYGCDKCGVEVKVEKDCGCAPCDLVCCGEQMKPKDKKDKGCCCG